MCGTNNNDINSFCDNCKNPFERSMPKKNQSKEKEEFIKAVNMGDKGILPKMWIGFAICMLLFIYEMLQGMIAMIPSAYSFSQFANLPFIIPAIVFYLFCIHRFHRILGVLASSKYSIKPAEAVFCNLIPIYNIYWIIKWPNEFSKFVNSRSSDKMLNGALLGFLLLLFSVIGRIFDGAIGNFLILIVLSYMNAKLRKQLDLNTVQERVIDN